MLKTLAAMTLVGCFAGSLAAAAQQASDNGWDIYTDRAAKITCGSRPVLLNGNHTDLTLSGPCRYVRVAGEHNDVTLTIVAGGTIEITGAHNDVFWYPLNATAARPTLLDHGSSNTFHRRTEGEN